MAAGGRLTRGRRQPGSLVVVGTGIKLVAHATSEAIFWLRRAEKLFHLLTDTAAEAWIQRLNPSAISLADCYAQGKSREKSYRDMTDRILTAVGQIIRVHVEDFAARVVTKQQQIG